MPGALRDQLTDLRIFDIRSRFLRAVGLEAVDLTGQEPFGVLTSQREGIDRCLLCARGNGRQNGASTDREREDES